VELQGRYEELKREGLGLIAISYDPPDVLKNFAASRGITFPLLSDAGSAIIKQYGLLNTTTDPNTRFYGIPFPGTFVVDRTGVVRARHFEEAYQERNTVGSILVRSGAAASGPSVIVESAHLSLTATLSDDRVAPGERISITWDVAPAPRMHVYAPGKHSYQVIRPSIDPQPWLRALAPSYPASEIYDFKPLGEQVEVYTKPFRLVQDVTVLATNDVQKLLASQSSVTITGRLDYQACDDMVCYLPQRVPVSWTVPLKALDRK
jgi:AhpC/TSA family/Thiol:disulfide interchange protein DsbD, N-terminal